MPKLTSREKEIVALVIQGNTNKGIAWKLRISEHTVKNHMVHILAKTKCASRAQMAVKQTLEDYRNSAGSEKAER